MNQTELGSLESIAIGSIRPSLTNPRKHFDGAALQELADSIAAQGMVQPVLVQPMVAVMTDKGEPIMEKYLLVTGERRYRAAKLAGLREIPGYVRELSREEALDIQMVENLQRADLHPMEEAEGYRVLMANGASAEDVAKKAGKGVGYVQQRLKLLTLEVDAKELFADGHITLGHALLLARLTPKDQENALVYLLGINAYEIKRERPAATIIRERIERRRGPDLEGLDPEDHAYQIEDFKRRTRGRLIDKTEAELKDWISGNVLLQLATAPWDLGDPDLYPIAGPCTTCPKRSGANAALFQDLTTAENTCTDPACFAEKQKLQTKRVQKIAEDKGTTLLKISAKSSHEKLEEKPVIVEHGHATVVTKKPVKEGQWVAAEEGSCPATVPAVAVDGANQGKTSFVCADQLCKVHKHTISRPEPQRTQSPEQKAAAEAKVAAAIAGETEIRDAVFAAMLAKMKLDLDYLRRAVVKAVQLSSTVCRLAGVSFATPERKSNEETWSYRRRLQDASSQALTKHLMSASVDELQRICFVHEFASSVAVDEWQAERGQLKQDRVSLWRAAKGMKVDADKIAARVEAEQQKRAAAAAPKAEPVKKKLSAVEQAKRKAQAARAFPTTAKKAKPAVDRKRAAAGDAAEQVGA